MFYPNARFSSLLPMPGVKQQDIELWVRDIEVQSLAVSFFVARNRAYVIR